MFFYFHAVFRHAVDVLVILPVTPSMPLHSSGLQHHFLNLTLKQNIVNKTFQQHNNLEKSVFESRVLGSCPSIPGMNMGGTLASYWWLLGFQKAVRHTDTTDWCVLGQWRVTATMSASTWSTYTWRGRGQDRQENIFSSNSTGFQSESPKPLLWATHSLAPPYLPDLLHTSAPTQTHSLRH